MSMSKPLVCLTLTSPTLEENAALVRKYNRYICLLYTSDAADEL